MPQKNAKTIKTKWNCEEQAVLQQFVQELKKQNWKLIAQKLNQKFPGKTKSAKQCREHYVNFIKFKEFAGLISDWSAAETNILFQKCLKVGSKWVQIAKFLPGRSQNSVKNHFYSSLRKLIRRMNKVKKVLRFKNKKNIKENCIFKLLECPANFNKQPNVIDEQMMDKQNFIWKLKYDVLKLSFFPEKQANSQQIVDLIHHIEHFKVLRRFQSITKHRNMANTKRKCFPPLIDPLDTKIQTKSLLQDKRLNITDCSGTQKANQINEGQNLIEQWQINQQDKVNQLQNYQKQSIIREKQQILGLQLHEIFIFSNNEQFLYQQDEWCQNFLQ